MTTPELPPLKASTYTRNSPKSEPVARSFTAKSVEARERILLARVAELESALSDAVALYGKPGGPWNVPSDPGGWLERARAAIDAAQGEVLPCGVYVAPQ